jgi:glycerol-3-phosphate responsive antiterminator
MLSKNLKESVLATRVTLEIEKLVGEVAIVQGLNSSEYLRKLILEDLEKRSLISTRLERLKEGIRNGTR